MSGNTQVLREYLLSLGFRVSKTEQKKFTVGLEAVEKGATRAGLAVAGVATAAVAMAEIYITQMEKLYYASRRTRSTVSELQNLSYAGKQIGLAGGVLEGSLEGFSRALRANPGLKAFLEGMVGPARGRSNAQLMLDMVKRLSSLPDSVAQQYAGMFGIDPDTYFALKTYGKELEDALRRRQQLTDDAGLDTEKLAEAAKEWNNELRDVSEHFEVMKGAAIQALLPAMKEIALVTKGVLDDWTQIFKNWTGFGDFFTKLAEGIFGQASGGGVKLSNDPRYGPQKGEQPAGNWVGQLLQGIGKHAQDNALSNDPHMNGGLGPAQAGGDKQARLTMLEKAYGLPAGLLDALWKQESGRGKNVYNAKSGAMGDFQLMPATSREYGAQGQEYDFDVSSEVAARKMQALLKWAKGDLAQAIAGYNVGEGNWARHGGRLGSQPAETQAYVPGVLGTMQQHNTFIIHGGGNPTEVAAAVGQRIEAANGDLVRTRSKHQ